MNAAPSGPLGAARSRRDATPGVLPPYPTGWYALCFSHELRPGDVRHGRYFGEDLVVLRTASGRAAALGAYCPHLGAHMGHGGRVVGEALRCPFHGFCFDAGGRCVSTPYGRKPPQCGTPAWPILERNGVVLAWYDAAGRAPWWDVPALPDDGFSRLYARRWARLRSHPQETAENSVDVGHLSAVHGYLDVAERRPLRTEGPYLNALYSMRRASPFGPGMPPVHADFEIHIHGLGYSLVEVTLQEQRMATRHFVLPVPTDGEHIELRIAVALRVPEPGRVAWPLGLLPRRVTSELLSRLTIRAYAHDVAQDFDIWQNKRYLERPALADGDGPIGRYRRWCRQFYPSVAEASGARGAGELEVALVGDGGAMGAG